MKTILTGFFLAALAAGTAFGQGQGENGRVLEAEGVTVTADRDSGGADRSAAVKPGENGDLSQPGQPDEQINYTLGPDDIIDISVARHAEFSGIFPVNQEGKIQYRFVGDIDVNGYTKKELEARVRNIVSGYIVNPQVDVTIVDFRSKVFYVIGEVGLPGKFYMRNESIPIREALMQAGLPTLGAAMRKCRLITPGQPGKVKKRYVDIYSVIYGGNLKFNVDMKPGDVLYVPSTIMAKIFKVIAPVTAPITNMADAQTGITTLNTKPATTNTRIRY
jgi:polysaccharide biosynthesis/export protein